MVLKSWQNTIWFIKTLHSLRSASWASHLCLFLLLTLNTGTLAPWGLRSGPHPRHQCQARAPTPPSVSSLLANLPPRLFRRVPGAEYTAEQLCNQGSCDLWGQKPHLSWCPTATSCLLWDSLFASVTMRNQVLKIFFWRKCTQSCLAFSSRSVTYWGGGQPQKWDK